MNNYLSYNNVTSMFTTFFCEILDLSTGMLTYSNAGHNYPYIIHANQKVEILFLSAGVPLGIVENFEFESGTIYLQEGDMIFLYTDGVTEAMDIKGNQYSNAALEAFLRSRAFSSAQDLIDATNKEIKQFVKNAPQSDDITLLAVHFL